MNPRAIAEAIGARWPGEAAVAPDDHTASLVIDVAPERLVDLCRMLLVDDDHGFVGLVVEEFPSHWELRYVFAAAVESSTVHLRIRAPLEHVEFPSIVTAVHAADWHEREAEDLFGLVFVGHPRLGDFVLHDDAWQEGVEPMRHRFRADTPVVDRRPQGDWRPRRVLQAPGAFVMPIGPVYGGLAESVHFLLETVGEDVVRAVPRLFYKYRGTEKLAEGRTVDEALLYAERFAATTAVAHALAFCLAVEQIADGDPPPRAAALRAFLAELERCRHHAGWVAAICESTGLAVAASHAAMIEEDLLRASGALTGHRYLFGLVVPGGLTTDLADNACAAALQAAQAAANRLARLEHRLRLSSSFLDRLEQVGIISSAEANEFGLVGPIARASGIRRDLRRSHPSGVYRDLPFEIPVEAEGDGYARLRILFAEIRVSVTLMERIVAQLRPGVVFRPTAPRAGAAIGSVEAPRGAAHHWLRLDDAGRVTRFHPMTPSFANWLGFRLGVERFAFQDFPIILATLGLSVAENDR